MNKFDGLVLPNLVVQAHAIRDGLTEDNRLIDAGSQILAGNSLQIRRSSPDTERELMRDSSPSIAAVNSVLSSRLSCTVSDKSIRLRRTTAPIIKVAAIPPTNQFVGFLAVSFGEAHGFEVLDPDACINAAIDRFGDVTASVSLAVSDRAALRSYTWHCRA